jgi:hypothetical protein
MAASAFLLLRAPLVAALLLGAAAGGNAARHGRGFAGALRQHSLVQTWNKELGGANEKDTPVTRVANLLKEMSATLEKEMEEDEALYHELACWCNNGEYQKSEFIEATESKISELQATIESLTAKSAELGTQIAELEAQVKADKAALAEATELREKQIQEFHGAELDSIQAIEQMKAALEVLSKHHGANAATPWMQSPAGSFLEVSSLESPWAQEHEDRLMSHSLEEFMRRNDMGDGVDATTRKAAAPTEKFLQQTSKGTSAESSADATAGWSTEDSALVRKALKTASAFMQEKHGGGYYPSYSAKSGEIVGVLKQLKEEMEGDLSEAQKTEQARAATFEQLRAAKTSEIENGEMMAEKKEDEKATTDNNLAEAKEDLGQEGEALAEAQEFLKNLKATCKEADTNFAARKAARLEEIKAVGETIEILTEDMGRDAMAGTYGFVQLRSERKQGGTRQRRQEAAARLREAAARTKNPELSVLATSVELDAFTKVKKAIDDMIAMLKVQQEEEVKKTDWCKAEIQQNEMETAKAEDLKSDLEAEVAELAQTIKELEKGIADNHAAIAELQTELQRATENRIKENLDYQKTVADQTVTIAVLKKALDRLATYYGSAAFLQREKRAAAQAKKQTPPVPQMEYKPNSGSTGVMQMIEKLIYEAKALVAESKKAEGEAQSAYETMIADTNGSVAALQADIVSKTEAKATNIKTKLAKEEDIADTVKELEGLYKYNADLHSECDYVLKNFMVRQEARAEEIEALQQATQILSGADLS